MFKKFIALAAIAFAASLGFADDAQAAKVTVHGSSTVANTLMLPNQAKIEKKSGQQLTIVANGSGNGVADLLAGKAQVAMISAPLDAVIAKLNQKNPGSVDGSLLIPHLVGATRVAFVTHPSNPVKNLTKKQITDILAGRIKNWSKVGGKNAPIVIMAEQKGGGVRSMVEKALLYGGDINGSVKVAQGGAAGVVPLVAKEAGALGITMDAAVEKGVKEITMDSAIQQPLILVTKGDPNKDVAKLIDAARSTGFY